MSWSSPRYAHQGISFQFSNPAFQPPQILVPSLLRFLVSNHPTTQSEFSTLEDPSLHPGIRSN